MRRLLVLMVFASVFVLSEHAAIGCSCASGDPRTSLQQSDGAFVGSLVSKSQPTPGPGGGVTNPGQQVTFVFNVERAVKGKIGDTVEVKSSGSGASCGIEAREGERIGLFLTKYEGSWKSNLCSQVDPDVLLRAAAPLPAPNSHGPVAVLLGGAFGEARVIGLDHKARTVFYGFGKGAVLKLSVCPGAGRVVELYTLSIPKEPYHETHLAVRELTRYHVLSDIRLRKLGDPAASVMAMSCRDETASEVLLFVARETEAEPEGTILRIRGSKESSIYRGPWRDATFGGAYAYLAGGQHGDHLERLDLRTGKRLKIATVKRQSAGAFVDAPVRSPDGTKVVALSTDYLSSVRLTLVDLSRSPARVRQTSIHGHDLYGSVLWRNDDSFVFLPQGGLARVFDTRLKTVASIPEWSSSAQVIYGSQVIGAQHGRILAANLPKGPAKQLRQFDSPVTYALAGVPQPAQLEPTPTPTPTMEETAEPAPTPSIGGPQAAAPTSERGGVPVGIATALAVLAAGSWALLRRRAR